MIETDEPVDRILWKASEKLQKPFIESQSEEILIGGAPGSGKSYGMYVKSVVRQLLHPGISTVFVRNFLHELEGPESTIPAMREMFGGVLEWKEQKKMFKVPCGNGVTGEIKFIYADGDEDVERKFKNFQVADMYIDQAEGFTGKQILIMKHRLRTTKACKPILNLSANPCGPGHGFLLHRYVLPSYGGNPLPEKITGRHHSWTVEVEFQGRKHSETREFIPALYSDNPDRRISENYEKNLMELPDHLREAYMTGRWDVFKGRFFVEFDPSVHVKEMPVNPSLRQVEAMDWGTSAPMCALFAQENSDGSVHVHHEIYQSGLLYYQQARLIKRKREELGTDPYALKVDPKSLKRKDGVEGRTMEQEFEDEDVVCQPAYNDRVEGWMAVKMFLNRRLVTISPRCEALIAALQDAQYDRKKATEDMKKTNRDHPCDAFRYLLADLYTYREKREEPEPFYSVNALLRRKEERRQEQCCEYFTFMDEVY